MPEVVHQGVNASYLHGFRYLFFDLLQSTIKVIFPAVIHQITVWKEFGEVNSQTIVDKRKVKSATVVSVDNLHSFKGFQYAISIYGVAH